MAEKGTFKQNLKLVLEKNKKAIIISSIVIVVIIAGTLGYISSVKKNVASWTDKIYPGVEVYGVDLGGLTKEEGLNIISEQLIPKINAKKIVVTINDTQKEILYSDIAPNYDSETILKEALAYGKDKGLFEKQNLIKSDEKHQLTPSVTIDEELLKAKEEEIKQAVNINPVNATLTISGATPLVTAEKIGYTVDSEEFHKMLMDSINGNPLENSEISLELKETEASIKAETLNLVDGQISTFSTNFSKGVDTGRDKNLAVALSYINGTVLMPGEEFSYYEKIGQTTPEKGYHLANVYVADRIEKDYGGGVCQISTTLYRAAMGANLRSTQRRNHSMMVGYAEAGMDATYAAGYIDYKFKNTYDFPVYIQGYTSGNKVVVNIYGNVAGMGGKTYKMTNEIVETYSPEIVKKEDPTLYVGQEKVKDSGLTGYKAKGYLITYQNGKQINKELVSTDVYTSMDRVISVGTKPVPEKPKAPETEESKAPEAEEAPAE